MNLARLFRRPCPDPVDQLFTRRLNTGGSARLLPEQQQSGHIGPEPLLRIPFRLEAEDSDIRVVVFSDPPGLLSLTIETPQGFQVPTAKSDWNVSMVEAGASILCGFRQPQSQDPHFRKGTWHLVLKVDLERFKRYLLSVRQTYPREFARMASNGVFYSASVLAAQRPAWTTLFPVEHCELAFPVG